MLKPQFILRVYWTCKIRHFFVPSQTDCLISTLGRIEGRPYNIGLSNLVHNQNHTLPGTELTHFTPIRLPMQLYIVGMAVASEEGFQMHFSLLYTKRDGNND